MPTKSATPINKRAKSQAKKQNYFPRLSPNFLLDSRDDAPLPRPIQHYRHWSLTLAVVMMAGVILGEWLGLAGLGYGMLYGMLGLAVCLAVLAICCAFITFRGSWLVAWSLAGSGAVLLGVASFSLDDKAVPAIPDLPTGPLNITAEVLASEHYRNNRQRVILRPTAGLADWDGGHKLRLVASGDIPPLTPGDRIFAEVSLSPLPTRLLPGGFDFRRYAAEQNIVSGGFVRAIHRQEATGKHGFSRLRTLFQRRIFAIMDSDEAAAVASALLIGFRAATTSELHESFRAAGLAHFLAISGLHMGLICGTIMVLVRGLLALPNIFASYFSSRKVAAIIALPLCFLFLLFAGVPISALRAFLMLALVLVAILLTRRGITLHHVALAAIIVLLSDPSSLFTPAFQMSFSAVFALVVAWTAWQKYRPLRKPGLATRITGYVLGVAATSLIASMAAMPFVLYHFGVTTGWSVAANIIGMPLMAFIIMPLGGIGLMLAAIGADFVPLLLMEWGIDRLIAVAEYFSDLPWARIVLPPPSPLATVLMAAALLIVGMGSRFWRATAAIPMLLASLIWASQPLPVAAVVVLYNKPLLAVMAADDRLVVSTRHSSNFAKRILATPFGESDTLYIRQHPEARCGDGFCLITSKHGQDAAIVWDRAALTPACRQADLVLSMVAARYPCRSGALLVDREEAFASGGMLIYPDGREVPVNGE